MFLEPFYPVYGKLRQAQLPDVSIDRVVLTTTGKIFVVYVDTTFSVYEAQLTRLDNQIRISTKYPEPLELYEAGLIELSAFSTYLAQYEGWLQELHAQS